MNQQEGPLRFQLWPDGRGFAKRAVDRALASENAALRDWQAVRKQGIALLGLTALEYLVTEIAEIEVAEIEVVEIDAGENARSDSYACALLIALSENFAVMAQEYAAQWQPDAAYRIAFETAIDGNAIYPDTQALLREALAGLRATSQQLGEKKLLRPLGAAPGEARPIRAEFRRLDLSTVSIAAQFAALAELLTLPGGLGVLSDQAAGGSNSLALSRASNGWAAALADLSMHNIASEDAAAAQELRELAGFAAVMSTILPWICPTPLGSRQALAPLTAINLVDRRAFLRSTLHASLGVSLAASLALSRKARSEPLLERAQFALLESYPHNDRSVARLLDSNGETLARIPLSLRGHGFVQDGERLWVFGRRPRKTMACIRLDRLSQERVVQGSPQSALLRPRSDAWRLPADHGKRHRDPARAGWRLRPAGN